MRGIAGITRKPRVPISTEEYVNAPNAGLNTRDPSTLMLPLFALDLVNMIPTSKGIELRQGCEEFAQWTGRGQTAMVSNNTNGDGPKMFVAAVDKIYDVTAGGAGTVSATGFSSALFDHVNFQGAVGQFLVICNGVDPVHHWTGSAWVEWTLVGGTPAAPGEVTGIDPAKLKGVISHQRRLWFVENNSTKVWYTDLESLGGVMNKLDIGPYLRRGGNIVALGSWTQDGGNGTQNMFVVASDQGEIVIYAGDDVSQAGHWQLVGTYSVSKPVNNKCFKNEGGDLLYWCRDGVMPLSTYRQQTTTVGGITDSINNTMTTLVTTRGNLPGFQMIDADMQNLLLFNVPSPNPAENVQYVFHKQTKAWSVFTGWAAESWVEFGGSMYFIAGEKMYRAFSGYTDADVRYKFRAQTAFNFFSDNIPERRSQRKRFLRVRPNIICAAVQPAVRIGIAVTPGITTSVTNDSTSTAPLSGGVWDVSLWDQAVWAGELFSFGSWQTVSGTGYCASFIMEGESQAELIWTAIEYSYERARRPGV